MTTDPLKAPFPYAGGKSKVADLVWSRLGNCDNFVEPFAGSLAVLLRRPANHFTGKYRVETVNDANHYLVNFWRAVAAVPDEVAKWANSPVSECDLHARHKWLVRSAEAVEFREKMRADPNHFDAKIAGWWVWGICCWIGSGWCEAGFQSVKIPELAHGMGRGLTAAHAVGCRPQLTDQFDIGRGVNAGHEKRPAIATGAGSGCNPSLGRGVHGVGGLASNLIDMDGGRGVHAAPAVQIPRLSSPGDGVNAIAAGTQDGLCASRRLWLTAWMQRLADRLRLVRTCYGHWSRVCDCDSTLVRLGTTGVFLDPPYPTHREDTGEHSRDGSLYINDRTQDLNALRDEVREWCVKWGGNVDIKIAVCGYEGDGYESLVRDHGWVCESWEANGGYANQRKAKGSKKSANAKRERIWFSPQCRKPTATLFDTAK